MHSANNITYISTEHWIRLGAYHDRCSNQVGLSIIRILITEIFMRDNAHCNAQVILSRGMAQY